MFSLLNGIYEELTYVRERPIALLGVESSGKSSILEWLKHYFSTSTSKSISEQPEQLSRVIPTVGLNVAKLKVCNERVLLWDLGGVKSLRSIWERYVNEAEALIWVVDSSDKSKLEDSRNTLKQLLDSKTNLKHSPLLVFANKQDLPDAMDAVKVSLALDLLMQAELRPQCVQPCSTQNGNGIREGIEWMMTCLKDDGAETKYGMRIP